MDSANVFSGISAGLVGAGLANMFDPFFAGQSKQPKNAGCCPECTMMASDDGVFISAKSGLGFVAITRNGKGHQMHGFSTLEDLTLGVAKLVETLQERKARQAAANTPDQGQPAGPITPFFPNFLQEMTEYLLVPIIERVIEKKLDLSRPIDPTGAAPPVEKPGRSDNGKQAALNAFLGKTNGIDPPLSRTAEEILTLVANALGVAGENWEAADLPSKIARTIHDLFPADAARHFAALGATELTRLFLDIARMDVPISIMRQNLDLNRLDALKAFFHATIVELRAIGVPNSDEPEPVEPAPAAAD